MLVLFAIFSDYHNANGDSDNDDSLSDYSEWQNIQFSVRLSLCVRVYAVRVCVVCARACDHPSMMYVFLLTLCVCVLLRSVMMFIGFACKFHDHTHSLSFFENFPQI